MKTKIRSYRVEATNFHNKEIPKVSSNYTCLAVITIDSAFKKIENYHLHVFLKELKYIKKEEIGHIPDDL